MDSTRARDPRGCGGGRVLAGRGGGAACGTTRGGSGDALRRHVLGLPLITAEVIPHKRAYRMLTIYSCWLPRSNRDHVKIFVFFLWSKLLNCWFERIDNHLLTLKYSMKTIVILYLKLTSKSISKVPNNCFTSWYTSTRLSTTKETKLSRQIGRR